MLRVGEVGCFDRILGAVWQCHGTAHTHTSSSINDDGGDHGAEGNNEEVEKKTMPSGARWKVN